MSKSRRVFSKSFKSRVVLEALKEQSTISVLAKKYDLLPGQISTWKASAVRNISAVFDDLNVKKNKEINPEKLYAQIGQLIIENDFLKKKLY